MLKKKPEIMLELSPKNLIASSCTRLKETGFQMLVIASSGSYGWT
jgi:hypothetical protein